MRVRLEKALQLVPEISGHRLMVLVRLMRQEADGRLRAERRGQQLRADALRLSGTAFRRPTRRFGSRGHRSLPSSAARCGGDASTRSATRCRPFCSQRCRNNDFGAWASEAYGVEAKPRNDDDPDPDAKDLESRRIGPGVGRAAGVAHDGGEFGHQGREAVRGRAVVQRVAGRLGQRRLGALGRRHRIARGLGLLIGVGEHQLAPGLAHVPLDVVGEHAQEDVRAHPIGGAVVDRAHLQIDRLERAERALDVGQRLVVAHAVGRVHLRRRAPRCG